MPNDKLIAELESLLQSSSLNIETDLEKAKNLSFVQLTLLTSIMSQCNECKSGSYTIDQDTYDQLITYVQKTKAYMSEGLTLLATSGDLNKETLESMMQNQEGKAPGLTL
jgi:hypothetical protein